MELRDAISGRRSVRRFARKQVPWELLQSIVDAGAEAPTACNRRAWSFIAVTDDNLKRRVVDEGGAGFLADAPILLLVSYGNQTDNTMWEDDVVSGSLAIQNILLKAYELGVGSCVVCHLPTRKRMRQLFGIPDTFTPIAVVALGYPEGFFRRNANNIHTTINLNRFEGKATKQPLIWLKRLGRRIYYLLPSAIRKRLKPVVDKIFEKKFE